MATNLSVPGVEVHLLGGGLRVRIVPEHDPAAEALEPAVQARWRELVAANPRYFDGPLLSVTRLEAAQGVMEVRRDRYARLAAQPQVATNVQQLSVTGVLTARDPAGALHVLLGRRGKTTRVYPGMWELGPSGGVNVPGLDVRELTEATLAQSLVMEVAEEAGMDISMLSLAPPRAVIRDLVAHSDDVVYLCHLGPMELGNVSGVNNWEYSEAMWLPVSAIPGFEAASAEEIIAPTKAIFRLLGWGNRGIRL